MEVEGNPAEKIQMTSDLFWRWLKRYRLYETNRFKMCESKT
jgi:hypothetical protein